MLIAVTYLCVAVFLGAVISRFLKIQRLPIHLRWELYPVAHEKGRAEYGGSYLEESNWWTKPRESSKAGELGSGPKTRASFSVASSAARGPALRKSAHGNR